METARRRAITGLRNLGRDEDADRIEDLSAREYADEKGIDIIENPRRCFMPKRTESRQELEAELEDLRTENEELADENEELQDQLDAVAEAIGVEEEEEEEAAEEEDDDNNGGNGR
jgi:predicted RNase H-like nuclease (RuvC/YqgF family)